MKWQKKITKKELKHIRETSNGTLKSFNRNLEFHRAEEAKGEICPCFECRAIAKKLGV